MHLWFTFIHRIDSIDNCSCPIQGNTIETFRLNIRWKKLIRWSFAKKQNEYQPTSDIDVSIALENIHFLQVRIDIKTPWKWFSQILSNTCHDFIKCKCFNGIIAELYDDIFHFLSSQWLFTFHKKLEIILWSPLLLRVHWFSIIPGIAYIYQIDFSTWKRSK